MRADRFWKRYSFARVGSGSKLRSLATVEMHSLFGLENFNPPIKFSGWIFPIVTDFAWTVA